MIRAGRLVAVLVVAVFTHTVLARAEVRFDVRPVFGEACLPRFARAELVVTLNNPTAAAWSGLVRVEEAAPDLRRMRTVRSVPVVVPGRGHVSVRVTTPSPVVGNQLVARLVDAHGALVASAPLAYSRTAETALIDATPGGHLARSLQAANPDFFGTGGDAFGSPLRMLAGLDTQARSIVPCAAERTPETGEIVLPRTVEGYSNVALVLMDTSTLVDLGARERVALTDYVLGGGSLALIVSSATDLQSEVLVDLVGTGVAAGAAGSVPNFARVWPGYHSPQYNFVEGDSSLGTAVAWHGGRLHHRALYKLVPNAPPDFLGATADHGFGEVHLLAWNPTRTPALDNPWSSNMVVRVAELTAHQQEDRLFQPAADTLPVPDAVREALAPRDPYRPSLGILFAALMAYALVGGPGLWRLSSYRGPTLRTLGLLAALSLGTCLVLWRVGHRSRLDLGRARALGLVDLAAGTTRGMVRRYHGYMPVDARSLDVRVDGADRSLIVDAASGRGAVTQRARDRKSVV